MLLDKINEVIEEKVRPFLQSHNGDLEVLSFEDGVLKVKMLGQCNGCPSADFTNESIIEEFVCEAVPEVKKVVVVNEVSEDLLALARKFLQQEKQ